MRLINALTVFKLSKAKCIFRLIYKTVIISNTRNNTNILITIKCCLTPVKRVQFRREIMWVRYGYKTEHMVTNSGHAVSES